MLREPLSPDEARRLARAILATGNVVFSKHALAEMATDNLTTQDALNTIRAGIFEPAEYENGGWRYRVRTQRMVFVVAFRSESEMVIVTAWRLRR